MAPEAFKSLTGDRSAQITTTFEEGYNLDVEALVKLAAIEHRLDRIAIADFACYSIHVLNTESEHDTELMASETVKAMPVPPDVATLSSVDADFFPLTTYFRARIQLFEPVRDPVSNQA